MVKRLILFAGCLIVLACLSSCSLQRELNKKESRQLQETFSQLGFDDHFSGFQLVELETAKVIFHYNGGQLFTPASNIKLLTWYAGSKILPDSLPSFQYCSRGDSVYVIPFGDPTVLHPEYRAFQKPVQVLQKAKKPVFIYRGMFTDQRFGPGWSWDDYPFGFQREKSLVPVYGNALWICPQDTSGQLSFIPDTNHLILLADTVSRFDTPSRNEFYNTIHPGRFQKKDECQALPLRMTDTLVLKLLSDTLQNRVRFLETLPDDTLVWDTLWSAPTDTVFQHMLWHSENFIAEQLLLLYSQYRLGHMDTDRFIDSFLLETHMNSPEGLSWRDGSGLSRYNKCSPEYMVRVLLRLYKHYGIEGLKTYLPGLNTPGTMQNWPDPQADYLFAKSGSMSFVYNLSGLIRGKSGKYYLFSFMNNNFAGSQRKLRRDMALFLNRLHQFL